MVELARPLFEELTERIVRNGSIRFDEYMELALYYPDGGFFGSGGGAGRASADFITSPEVGPLFGAVVAEFLDARWQELGCPDPFVVIEAAAGRGALALAIRAAEPACSAALRYVLVERSELLRDRQARYLPLVHPFEIFGPASDEDVGLRAVDQGIGPLFCSLADLPAEAIRGVVIANELLDNLPIRILERTQNGWFELRVTLADGELEELLVPADPSVQRAADELLPQALLGVRIPLQSQAVHWMYQALGVTQAGSVLVIDYCASSQDMAERRSEEWLRTYRSHGRGSNPLMVPGTQDITCEVAVDQLERFSAAFQRCTQADWLRRWGIERFVDEGRQIWSEGAAAGNLAAVRGRSRVAEAEALLDPGGLGGFEVLEWRIG
ncbi:MAG: SAM-dependent methyltransferase [Actinomycetes bacterium]